MRNENASTINIMETHEIAGAGQFSESVPNATNQSEKPNLENQTPYFLETQTNTTEHESGSLSTRFAAKSKRVSKAQQLREMDITNLLTTSPEIQLETLTAEIQTKNNELEQLRGQMVIAIEKHNTLEKREQTLTQQYQELQASQVAREAKVTEQNTQITHLEQHGAELQNQIRQMQILSEETQAQINALQQQIVQDQTNHQRQKTELENQLENSKNQLAEQENSLNTLKNQLNEEKNMITTQQIEQTQNLEALQSKWQESLETVQLETDSKWQMKLLAAEEKIATLQKQKEDYQQTITQLNQQLSRISNELKQQLDAL
jgi:chromosome segregation ATPase